MNNWLRERFNVPALWITVFVICVGFPSRAGAQLLRTVVGSSTAGYSGDGGPASNALLQNPFGLALDSAGNVYIGDSNNNRVRVVNTGSSAITVANVTIQPGNIATVAGNGNAGFSGDSGPAISAQLNNPSGVAVDSNGNIYIADLNNFRVRKVSPNGIITTVTGNGSGAYGGDYGPAINGTLFPYAIAVDSTGNLYIADTGNQRIRVINMGSTGMLLAGIYIPAGYIASVAGTGVEGYGGDGGLAGSAEFDNPYSVAVDSNRTIYVCDTYNRRIRAINTGTSPIVVATVSIPPAYIATVAGNGVYQYRGDGGPAINANFADPDGVFVDSVGNIYVSDLEAERIRFVNHSTGIVNTIAGSSIYGYNGDNLPAITAAISYPRSLAVDSSGNVYFDDEPNQRVREVVANTGNFTSRANTAFTAGTPGVFLVTTNNAPPPALTVTGTLPNGITFVDHGNGSGTLGGTPAVGSDGIYNLTFTASNGVFPNTVQNFTLTVYTPGGAPTANVASFVSRDITTQGSWPAAYGADGSFLATLAPQLPAYATVAVQNQSEFTWGINPVDPRALQIAGTAGKIAATWFNPVSFTLDVNVGTGSHLVTIYVIDWDSKGRSQTIQVQDADTGAPLDTQVVSGFSGGVYLSWNITGHVQIVATASTAPNSVISGIFFGAGATGGGGGGTGGSTPFLIAYTAGIFRNNFTGWIGMKVTVAGSAMNVTSIGRICVPGDAAIHTVKFVDANTGLDLPGGSASVNLGGCTVGQFVYVPLPSALLLPAGASYYLVSQEFATGDVWYDSRPLVSTTAALVNSSIYSLDGALWVPTNTANTSYGPPNFLYTTVPSVPVNVTVQSNPPGASFSVDGTNYSGTHVFNWTAGALHTIAAASSQSSGAGTQYKWTNWSDGGTMSHAVAPTTDANYTATFSTQFLLSTNVTPTGAGFISANPPSGTGFYDSGTQVQLTATQGSPVCSFSGWTGDLSGSTNPQTVTMSAQHAATAGFQCSSSPANSFLTGYALNGPGLRNDFSGWVGMKFTVGSMALSVSSLGRICVAGNSGTHTVKLVNASTGTDVAQGSIAVSMSGCGAGQFKYTSLGGLTLQANTAYYLVSQESSDQWYDYGTVASTSDAAVNNSIYSSGASWGSSGGANTSYVPLNFVYAVIPPGPPDLTITTTHSGDFTQGDAADTYTIAVANSGGSSTSTAVSVTVTVPSGLTATSIAGGGWTCTQPAGPCSRSDALAGGGSYSALTLTLSVASNAAASLTTAAVVSGGGETNTSNDTAADPTNINAPSAGTNFVTAYGLNGPSVRNNYSGWLGMQFTVGSSALTVSSIGRVCIAGNSAAHAVKLVNATTGLDVPQGSVSLSMSGCIPGQFKYTSKNVTLQANTAYYLVSNEFSGVDQWYDYGSLTHTSVAAVNGSVYSNGTGWSTINTPNTSYVPVDFLYATAAPPPSPADLTVAVTHSGNFTQGDTGRTYTITAANAGGSATNGAVSVTVTVPAGLTPTAMSGGGWTCTQPAGPCSRNDSLSGTLPTLTLTVDVASNAPSSLTTTAVVSGGGETNTANDAANDATTVNPLNSGGGSGTNFVTAFALNGPPVRNNFGGWVGMKLTVGTSSLSVSSLGRICIVGNSGTHLVKVVDATSGLDVPSGSVSLSMSGCTPGQFKFAPSSVTLQASTAYYLVSQETSGGDQWYDYGTLANTSVAAVNGSVYSNGSGWSTINTPNTSYVPLNFVYATAAPPPPGPPDLTIGITHSGDFVQGDTADTYTITVGNSGGSATSGAVSVTLTVPIGLIATGIAGGGWACTQPAGPCSRSDVLAAGGTYPLTLTVGVASNASSSLTTTAVVAGGGETNTGNDTANDPTTIDPSGSGTGSGTSFVTTYALNGPPVRNNFSGWVGMKFTVGTSSMSVSSLGRMCIAGNSGTHAVKLVNAGTGLDVGSVSLNMAGCSAGQFKYGSLSLTLQAGTAYYLVTQEASGGDQWYDYGTLTTTSAAAVNGSVYSSGASWALIGTPNTSYVPLSFLYAAGPPDTTLLSGFTPNSNLRNDFSGWVGTKFTVGPANVTVHSLGRMFVAGNAGTHTVKIALASDGSDVPGASVSLSMPGGTAGQFWYAALASPVTLEANTSYYLISQEQGGADFWYDFGIVSPTSLAAVNGAAYFDGTKFVLVGGANYAYVPLDFK